MRRLLKIYFFVLIGLAAIEPAEAQLRMPNYCPLRIETPHLSPFYRLGWSPHNSIERLIYSVTGRLRNTDPNNWSVVLDFGRKDWEKTLFNTQGQVVNTIKYQYLYTRGSGWKIKRWTDGVLVDDTGWSSSPLFSTDGWGESKETLALTAPTGASTLEQTSVYTDFRLLPVIPPTYPTEVMVGWGGMEWPDGVHRSTIPEEDIEPWYERQVYLYPGQTPWGIVIEVLKNRNYTVEQAEVVASEVLCEKATQDAFDQSPILISQMSVKAMEVIHE